MQSSDWLHHIVVHRDKAAGLLVEFGLRFIGPPVLLLAGQIKSATILIEAVCELVANDCTNCAIIHTEGAALVEEGRTEHCGWDCFKKEENQLTFESICIITTY